MPGLYSFLFKDLCHYAFHDLAVNVGQAELAALVAERELFVVDAEQVE